MAQQHPSAFSIIGILIDNGASLSLVDESVLKQMPLYFPQEHKLLGKILIELDRRDREAVVRVQEAEARAEEQREQDYQSKKKGFDKSKPITSTEGLAFELQLNLKMTLDHKKHQLLIDLLKRFAANISQQVLLNQQDPNKITSDSIYKVVYSEVFKNIAIDNDFVAIFGGLDLAQQADFILAAVKNTNFIQSSLPKFYSYTCGNNKTLLQNMIDATEIWKNPKVDEVVITQPQVDIQQVMIPNKVMQLKDSDHVYVFIDDFLVNDEVTQQKLLLVMNENCEGKNGVGLLAFILARIGKLNSDIEKDHEVGGDTVVQEEERDQWLTWASTLVDGLSHEYFSGLTPQQYSHVENGFKLLDESQLKLKRELQDKIPALAQPSLQDDTQRIEPKIKQQEFKQKKRAVKKEQREVKQEKQAVEGVQRKYRPLSAGQIFQLTLQEVGKEIEGAKIIQIDVPKQGILNRASAGDNTILARVYISGDVAHVVYYPGVDRGTKELHEADIPLDEVVRAVDDQLVDIKELRGKQVKKHITVGVYAKATFNENHFVAISEVKGQLRVINPKGLTAGMTDPNMVYIEKVLPDVIKKPLHADIQNFDDVSSCGYFVAAIHKATVTEGAKRRDIEAISREAACQAFDTVPQPVQEEFTNSQPSKLVIVAGVGKSKVKDEQNQLDDWEEIQGELNSTGNGGGFGSNPDNEDDADLNQGPLYQKQSEPEGFFARHWRTILSSGLGTAAAFGVTGLWVGATIGAPWFGVGALAGAGILGAIGYAGGFLVGVVGGTIACAIADSVQEKRVVEQREEVVDPYTPRFGSGQRAIRSGMGQTPDTPRNQQEAQLTTQTGPAVPTSPDNIRPVLQQSPQQGQSSSPTSPRPGSGYNSDSD